MCRLFELFYLFGVYQESARCGSPNNGCQHKCTNGVCSCNAGYNLVGSKQCMAKDCGAIKLTYCASGLYTWIVYHTIPYHTILYYTMLPCHTRPYMIISNHVCKFPGTQLGTTCKHAIVSCPNNQTTFPVSCSILCPSTYALKGVSSVTCTAAGTWTSTSATYCRRINDPPSQV